MARMVKQRPKLVEISVLGVKLEGEYRSPRDLPIYVRFVGWGQLGLVDFHERDLGFCLVRFRSRNTSDDLRDSG